MFKGVRKHFNQDTHTHPRLYRLWDTLSLSYLNFSNFKNSFEKWSSSTYPNKARHNIYLFHFQTHQESPPPTHFPTPLPIFPAHPNCPLPLSSIHLLLASYAGQFFKNSTEVRAFKFENYWFFFLKKYLLYN